MTENRPTSGNAKHVRKSPSTDQTVDRGPVIHVCDWPIRRQTYAILESALGQEQAEKHCAGLAARDVAEPVKPKKVIAPSKWFGKRV